MNEKERFIKSVWPKVCKYLHEKGSSNYDGYIGDKKQGWLGPYIWGENGDLIRLITRYCEDEFGFDKVHNESKIDKFRYKKFTKKHKRKLIDIDVTDATDCKSADDFRELQHALFIEVKHISKGCIREGDKKKIQGFKDDCKKLQEEIDEERCKYAVAILVDDGDSNNNPYVKSKKEFIKGIKKGYPKVEPLIWQKKSK